MITLDRRSFMITTGLATAGLAALSGCGRGSAAPETGRSVQLGFSWWGNDLRRKTFQQVIDDYQAQHPDVGIVGESSDFDPYWDRLATRLAAGDEPDVISMDYAYFREYAERGALLDLSAHGAEDRSVPGLAAGHRPGRREAARAGPRVERDGPVDQSGDLRRRRRRRCPTTRRAGPGTTCSRSPGS